MDSSRNQPICLAPPVGRRWPAVGSRLILALAALLCLPATGWTGDDSPVAGGEGAPQVLLLRNGSILRGKILARGEDYLVAAPHGQIVVPGAIVRAACQDLQGAYEVLLERAAAQSEGAAYVSLAKWCQSVHMYDEAKANLELALNLDANLDEARQLLTLNEELRLEHKRASRPPDEPREPGVARPESTASLGGLPASLAAQFTSRIQPILTNNCSTASCHGPRSENGFRLERVQVGQRSDRGAVERNLVSVLDFLDLQQPAQSPLLSRAREAHGKPARPLMAGTAGQKQWRELQAWVKAAAPHLRGLQADPQPLSQTPRRDRKKKTVNAPTPNDIVLAAGDEESASDEMTDDSPGNSPPAEPAGAASGPPARWPPKASARTAANGAAVRGSAGRGGPGDNPGAESPPARLKPRSQDKSVPPAATVRDLFDPDEFNRQRRTGAR